MMLGNQKAQAMTQSCLALVCHTLSDDLSGVALKQIPIPAPGPGQALVRIAAASVNFPDLLMTRGGYQFKPELPFIPGLEAAGRIIALGQARPDAPTPEQPLQIDDRVLVHGKTGGFAQYACVPLDALRKTPIALDDAQAAAFQAAATTAYVALVRRAALQAGETLLVHGATGGVGWATVQLGKHLGARVIATGSSPAKLARLREVEGIETVELAAGLREQVLAMTDGRGADVIFDPVGGDVFDASVRCIAWGGRLLVVGFAAGRIPQLAMNLPLIKGFSIVGVRAGEYGRRDPVRGAQNIQAIDALANAGVFRPYIGARFELRQAREALAVLARREVLGKVVIEMPPGD
jgi:NADPH2:quinone reductase